MSNNYRRVATASTNAAVIDATPGHILGWVLTNTSAAVKYVKFYDKATAPTVGTDAPLITVVIPATSCVCFWTDGREDISYLNGLGIAMTGLGTDADATAVAANDVIAQVFWK